MEEGSVTILTLLDLFAFDTALSPILTWHYIGGIALEWFVSYLSRHKQQVKRMDYLSWLAEVTLGISRDPVSAHGLYKNISTL